MQPFASRFLRRAFRVLLRALRRLPWLAQREFGIYSNIESQLHAAARPLRVVTCAPMLLLDRQCIRESLSGNSSYRVLDLHNLTQDDCDFIARQSWQLEHLIANLPAEHLDATFQLDALRAGTIGIVSPTSGRGLQSDRSLLAGPRHTLFYRFEEHGAAFYLAVGREGMGYIWLFLFFPHNNCVVLLGDREWAWTGRWEVDQFRAFLIAHWPVLTARLNDNAPRRRCVLIDQQHFAHHIWNTLPGLQKILRQECMEHCDEVAVTAEPLGPVDEIFPELRSRPIARLTDAQLVSRALRENLLLIRPGGRLVDDDIVQRLCRVAREHVPAEAVLDAERLRGERWPILWVTVRTGIRTWVSQAPGIANIANRLHATYPRLALFVDGYCIPWDVGALGPKEQELVLAELALLDAIRKQLDPEIVVRTSIGRPILESVVYSQIVDCYLAHHGALQNKIGWLANRPGVVHSNTKVLRGIGGTKRYYPAFTSRADLVPPLYLDAGCVTDVEGAEAVDRPRWDNPVDLYDFDDAVAARQIARILEEEQAKGRFR